MMLVCFAVGMCVGFCFGFWVWDLILGEELEKLRRDKLFSEDEQTK